MKHVKVLHPSKTDMEEIINIDIALASHKLSYYKISIFICITLMSLIKSEIDEIPIRQSCPLPKYCMACVIDEVILC